MHSYFCILLLDTYSTFYHISASGYLRYILSHICAALSETESIGDNSRTQTDLSALSLLRSCSGIFLKATSEDIISVASSGESCESGTRVWRGACRQWDAAACWWPMYAPRGDPCVTWRVQTLDAAACWDPMNAPRGDPRVAWCMPTMGCKQRFDVH